MSKPLIRPGTLQDCLSLAPRLRPEDALELELASGKTPLEVLKESLEVSSECFAAEADGLVIAMGGCRYIEEMSVGVPWLVGSPEILNHPVSLVAAGRVAVDRWGKNCSVLCNLTHAENHVHHRWLRHIGFSFMPDPWPMGPTRAPFLQFFRHSQ